MRKYARKTARMADDVIPLPKRPFLGSALFYGILAGTLVAVTWGTGGGVVRAAIVAGAFFVVATTWSWWRFHQKLLERAREENAKR